MEDCNACAIPMPHGAVFTKGTEDTTVEDNLRPLIGALRYGCITRPDICTAVGIISRPSNAPTKEVVAASKQILRYIKGTLQYGLIYKRTKEVDVHGYVDANLAGDINDRRSTTGYAFYLNGASNPVTFHSGIQSCVATSTCHAEYMAAYKAGIMAVHLRGILLELGITFTNSMEIYEDNSAAIMLSENPVLHKTTMHFAVKYYWIREQVERGIFKLIKVETANQVADALSKPLAAPLYKKFVHCLACDSAKNVPVHHE